uniref:Uncharacterized protein n=1 Tax=Pelinobius muticus TaxID=753628 RepID=D5J705_PELMU|nr:hypothetical protein [Pelinobius muticus]
MNHNSDTTEKPLKCTSITHCYI